MSLGVHRNAKTLDQWWNFKWERMCEKSREIFSMEIRLKVFVGIIVYIRLVYRHIGMSVEFGCSLGGSERIKFEESVAHHSHTYCVGGFVFFVVARAHNNVTIIINNQIWNGKKRNIDKTKWVQKKEKDDDDETKGKIGLVSNGWLNIAATMFTVMVMIMITPRERHGIYKDDFCRRKKRTMESRRKKFLL